MNIIEKLNKRYATKKFSDKKIPNQDFEIILESARLSASSFGLQPYKLVVINNTVLRNKLREAAFDQPQVTESSHVIIFAALDNVNHKTADEYIQLVSTTRNINIDALKSYNEMIKNKIEILKENNKLRYWVNRQIYIALGSVLETAALLDIDACPMEGFSTDEVDRILDLEKLGLRSVVMCTFGYRSPDDTYQHLKKVRQSSDAFYINL